MNCTLWVESSKVTQNEGFGQLIRAILTPIFITKMSCFVHIFKVLLKRLHSIGLQIGNKGLNIVFLCSHVATPGYIDHGP